MRKQFTKPSYSSSEELTFGVANNPIKLENGITIGGGTVYPEINFTLPPMTITQETMPEVLDQY
ncbi:MAG: methyltransferase MtaB domain-containing protein, partial [Atribacterota bacterium]